MAALTKITGRRVEVIPLVVPDPPLDPPPYNPPGIPPPPTQPDPIILTPPQEMYLTVIVLGGIQFSAYFYNGAQVSIWTDGGVIKLYPDYHPLARTVIPAWDYYNW